MRTLLLVLVLMASTSAFALSEQNYHSNYSEKVLPYFQTGKSGTFQGVDQLNIHYMTFLSGKPSATCLLILPGRQEQLEKYAEVVYDLKNSSAGKNLSIFLIDHRGQGSSDRMVENPQIGYVDHFEDYIQDVETFMDRSIIPENCAKHYMLAHSMGGAIGLGVISEYPQFFSAVTFSAPMWKINTHPYSNFIARTIVEAEVLLGQGKKYGVGQKDLNIDVPFEKNITTNSESRYQMSMDIYRKFPATKLGGVSNRWVNEGLKYTHHLRKTVKGLKIPMTLFEAGEDQFVKVAGEDQICAQNPFCVKTYFEFAKHELLMERDPVRNVVMEKVVEMLNTP